MSGPPEYGVPPLPYSRVLVGLIRGGPTIAFAESIAFGRPIGGPGIMGGIFGGRAINAPP
jgi:hypothetical protein